MKNKTERNILADIKKTLKEADIKFHHFKHDKEVTEILCGMSGVNCNLRLRIIVSQGRRENVRIVVVLPIYLNKKYVFPLGEYISKKDFWYKYGKMHVTDENEICFEYTFPPRYDYTSNDFTGIALAIVSSADEEYETISRYCVGKFSKEEKSELLEKAKSLIAELSDDEAEDKNTSGESKNVGLMEYLKRLRERIGTRAEQDEEEGEEEDDDDDETVSDLFELDENDGDDDEEDDDSDDEDGTLSDLFELDENDDEDDEGANQ